MLFIVDFLATKQQNLTVLRRIYSRLRTWYSSQEPISLDTLFKGVIPVCIGSITLMMSIMTYADKKSEEYRKSYWLQQYQVYEELTAAAAKIVVAVDLPSSQEARMEFWQLYWGKLPLIESEEVAVAAIEFAKHLARCETGEPDTSCFFLYEGGLQGHAPTVLRRKALMISFCARESLGHTWAPVALGSTGIIPGVDHTTCIYSTTYQTRFWRFIENAFSD